MIKTCNRMYRESHGKNKVSLNVGLQVLKDLKNIRLGLSNLTNTYKVYHKYVSDLLNH